MLTPLITRHSVICNPSQATEIMPSLLVQDSQLNNLPPVPITVTSDVSVLNFESQARDAHIDQAHCTTSLDWLDFSVH